MIIDNNQIVLRPRFTMEVNQNQLVLMDKFNVCKNKSNNKYISRVRPTYVLLDIPEVDNKFWSPQLELRIEKMEENTSEVNFLYGPKGIVWTFFIFLHFVCAAIFTVSFVIGYSKWSLEKPYGLSVVVCVAMVVVWFTFYFLGRIGKRLAKSQMNELHQFVINVLNN